MFNIDCHRKLLLDLITLPVSASTMHHHWLCCECLERTPRGTVEIDPAGGL